jgi:putative addiction module component (TIGR02574 family)
MVTEKRASVTLNATNDLVDFSVMSIEAKKVLEQALHLSQQERAVVAEGLLSSLDRPDLTIDELWAEEVEARIDAAERGEMEMVSEQEVFGKYEKR